MADAGRNLLLIVMTVFQAIIFKTVCETEVYKKPKASSGDSNFSGKGAPVIAPGEAHTRSTAGKSPGNEFEKYSNSRELKGSLDWQKVRVR